MKFSWVLLHPRYWPTYIGLAVMRLFAPLPYPVLRVLGVGVGTLVYALPSAFKRVARRNIDLCLTDSPPQERRRILRDHFHSSVSVCSRRRCRGGWAERIRN